MAKRKRTPAQGKINKESILILLVSIGITGIIAWLFYRSYFGLVVFPLVLLITRKKMRRSFEKKLVSTRRREYKEMLLAVSNSLATGYSVENAFKEAQRELSLMYGKDAWIVESLSSVNRQVSLSVPIEKAFSNFAEAYPMEEIKSFSEIFTFAKRLGGDYAKHIRRTAKKLEERIELLTEIDVLTSEKRMELNVMCIMPAGMILYQNLGAPEFLAPVYGNIPGIALMSACLLFYAGMMLLGDKIVDIKV